MLSHTSLIDRGPSFAPGRWWSRRLTHHSVRGRRLAWRASDGARWSRRAIHRHGRRGDPGAVVHVVGTSYGGVTDGGGRYASSPSPTGSYVVSLRRLGFASDTFSVTVGSERL